MVTMQVRSLAMLQRRLYSCRPGVVIAKQHAVEKTFLVAQPIQLVALTGEALCGETGFCCGFWTPNWCPQKSLFSIP